MKHMTELVPLSSLSHHSLHHHVNHAFTINTQYLPTFQNLPMSPKQKKSCRIPIKVCCLQCYHSTSSASTLKYRKFSGSYYSSPKRKVVSPYLKNTSDIQFTHSALNTTRTKILSMIKVTLTFFHPLLLNHHAHKRPIHHSSLV